MLTYWLLMTSIPLLVEIIECKQFRCIYLKNKIFFWVFFAFFEYALNFEHFQTKMTIIAYVFPQLQKTRLDKCLKAPVWEVRSRDGMGNGRKHWFNLNESAFIILIDHCAGNWVGKVTLSHMKCLNTFCSQIDCRWQVFPY